MSIAMIRAQKFTVLTEQRRVVAALLIAATATIAGCASHNEGAATPVSTSSSLTSAVTAAPPPGIGFPDLSTYAENTSGRYELINIPRVQGFSFSTPSGLICGSNAYPDVEYEQVGCRGSIPGRGPGDWSVSARVSTPATIQSMTGDPDLAADSHDPPPVLAPLQKVRASKGDAVCAVGADDLIACRVGGHGFVLTPTTTTLF